MSKIIWIAVLLIILCWWTFAGTVVNPDKPLKGEWNFQAKKIWQAQATGKDLLVNVANIDCAKDGRVYLSDFKLGKMMIFAADGKFIRSFGNRGEGPGEFRFLRPFYLQGDNVLIPDMQKILEFDREGKFCREIKLQKMIFPLAFIDQDRFIHIPFGDVRDEKKSEPKNIEIFSISDTTNKKIISIPPEKNLTYSGGEMRVVLKIGGTQPEVVLAYYQDHIYYGRSDSYLLHKVDLNGKELLSFSISNREKTKISADIKKRILGKVSLNGGKMPDEMMKQMMEQIPDEAPYFKRFWIDPRGMIYVLVNHPQITNAQVLDIFSPEGKYLYQAKFSLPQDYTLGALTFISDGIIFFAEDEEGEGALYKYQLKFPSA